MATEENNTVDSNEKVLDNPMAGTPEDEGTAEASATTDGADAGHGGTSAAVAAAVAAAKQGGKKGKPSAGQRLAAQQAAKAARKAAAKQAREEERRAADEPEAEDLGPDEVEVAAEAVTDWFTENQKMLVGVASAIVLGAGAYFGIGAVLGSKNAEVASLLNEANTTAIAPVIPSTDVNDSDEESYSSVAARAERSLEEFRAVVSHDKAAAAATWAQIGEGRAQLELGKYDEAVKAFDGALSSGGDDVLVKRAAIEGMGAALEAQDKWDEAAAKYEQLGAAEDPALKLAADYHKARVMQAKGDVVKATEMLRSVSDKLKAEDAPKLPYIKARVTSRLRALDGGEAETAPQMDPAQLQELIRRMQQQGGGQ